MALITKPHALPDQRKSLFPGEIPSDATHLVWFRWEDGTTVVQFADTSLIPRWAWDVQLVKKGA